MLIFVLLLKYFITRNIIIALDKKGSVFFKFNIIGKFFQDTKICPKQTIISVTTVAMVAPIACFPGINTQFKLIFTTAPIVIEYIYFLSFP